MADNDTEDKQAPRPFIWTSFCPELGIYYYRNELDQEADPIVMKFTHEELLAHIEGLHRAKKSELGRELCVVCAWARAFSHLMMVFYTDGTFKAHKPPPLPPEALQDVVEMKEYVEEWKKKHTDSSMVPDAPKFGRSEP